MVSSGNQGGSAKKADYTSQNAPSKSAPDGSSLAPDFAKFGRQTGVVRRYKYWVGVMPEAPINSIDLAGVRFPKMVEPQTEIPGQPDKYRPVPKPGALAWFTEDAIRTLQHQLQHRVIRFHALKPQVQEPGTGENIGDPHLRGDRAHIIRVPTDEQVTMGRKSGRPVRAYEHREGDEPAAKYVYAILSHDQTLATDAGRSDRGPISLYEMGLIWPEDVGGYEAAMRMI